MANTIKLRRSAVQGAVPTTSQILLGELGVNTYDGKLFLKKSTSGAETGAGTSVVEIGAGGAGGTYTVSATAPSSPAQGDRWLETDAGVEYTYFNDGSSSQWVETGIGGSGGGGGDVTLAGANAFTGANTFFNTTGQTIGTDTSTQDGLILKGRAGGSTSLRVTIEPGTLTSSRTLTLPDVTGTVITTGDTGTVTSAMIADGTIVDGDINASAAIAYSKLAALTSANILVGSATNVATSTAMSGDVTISNTGVTTVTSASTSAAGKVQLNDTVTSTSTSLASTANAAKTAYDIGAKRAITIENPTATEKIIMFFTTTAMTLSQIRSVIIGGTSVDFRIIYGTDVSAAGTNTTTNAITCNSTTTGVSTTSFSSATVPANNFVWLTTSAVSGTVTQLSVSLVF